MAVIEIYNNEQRVAKTSKAYNAIIVHELMRMYTLSFELFNADNARKYITVGSTFVAKGQAFDITGYNMNSGTENNTIVSAEHVSYRLNNYKLDTGYSCIGTVSQIAQDILNNAFNENGVAARNEFVVGTCANMGTVSFELKNQEIVTARLAILALKSIGIEIDWDNFTIKLPVKVGTGSVHTFKFGKDLCNFNRTWDIENGTTYDVENANLQRIPDHEGDIYGLGDDSIIEDEFIGDIVQSRIITYTECLDDPLQDSIRLGVFIRDSATDSVAMQVDIDTRIQQGKLYNNTSMSHQDGIKTITSDGNIKVIQNATNGFLVQHLVNGDWVTIWEVVSESGIMAAYNTDHTQKIEFGGDYGLTTWQYISGAWKQTGGLDTNGNNMSSKLFNPNNPNFMVMIGRGINDSDGGLMLYDANASTNSPFLKIWYSAQGETVFQKTQPGRFTLANADNSSYGKTTKVLLSVGGSPKYFDFVSGILVSVTDA